MKNGTLYSYATVFVLYDLCFTCIRHSIQSPIIQKSYNGNHILYMEDERGSHLQNSPSTVWDTALLSYALQEAQVPKASKVIHNASAYLLRKQQTKKVD